MENDFQSWFLSNGGTIHPSVEIASNATGSFLRARQGNELSPGSCVISCPHTLTVSWLNVMDDCEFLTKGFDMRSTSPLTNETVLARFFLMKQYGLKKRSFWWPYIESLPQPDVGRHLNMPFWYDAEDLVWIRGTNLEYAMEEKEKLWRQEFDEGAKFPALNGSEPDPNWSWLVLFSY